MVFEKPRADRLARGLLFQFAELGRRFLMFERQRFPVRLIVDAVVAVVGFLTSSRC